MSEGPKVRLVTQEGDGLEVSNTSKLTNSLRLTLKSRSSLS